MFKCQEIKLEQDLSWDQLMKASSTATFFQIKDWLETWLKHFPAEHKIIGVYEEGELIGIAPLVISHSGDSERSVEDSRIMTSRDSGHLPADATHQALQAGARMTERVIELLGVTPVLEGELVSDFGDIIVEEGREKEVWETVLNEIRRHPELVSGSYVFSDEMLKRVQHDTPKIELNFIREDSPSFKVLKELGGEIAEVEAAPYLDLPKTWEEYLISLERHNRHELKRKMRKIENEDVSSVSSSGSLEDINELFRLMEISSEEKRRFLSPEMKAFFQDIIISGYKNKRAELMFMTKDKMNIAATLSFYYRDEVLLYNSGFDPEFGYLSAGLILKAHLIKRAIEQNKKRFDFLRGNERYKYDLGGKERKLYNISFEN